MRERPKPGEITVSEIRVKICAHCGFRVSDTGLCSMDCDLDAELRTRQDYFFAVYERTEKFLRDER